jgi:opacity protein-like surface antigen
VSGYFSRYVGITADFAGAYGTPAINVPSIGSFDIHTHLYTFMFGPTVRVANNSPLQPFGHALFGGAHLTGSVGIPVSGFGGSITDSDTGFAWAAGGGLDFKAIPLISLRVAQFDFVHTHIGGDNQNHFRYSAGVVLRF